MRGDIAKRNEQILTNNCYCANDKSKPYPTRVEVKHKETKGWIAIDQIRTIDRIRFVKKFETLTEKKIEKVKSVIQETFVG